PSPVSCCGRAVAIRWWSTSGVDPTIARREVTIPPPIASVTCRTRMSCALVGAVRPRLGSPEQRAQRAAAGGLGAARGRLRGLGGLGGSRLGLLLDRGLGFGLVLDRCLGGGDLCGVVDVGGLVGVDVRLVR